MPMYQNSEDESVVIEIGTGDILISVAGQAEDALPNEIVFTEQVPRAIGEYSNELTGSDTSQIPGAKVRLIFRNPASRDVLLERLVALFTDPKIKRRAAGERD